MKEKRFEAMQCDNNELIYKYLLSNIPGCLQYIQNQSKQKNLLDVHTSICTQLLFNTKYFKKLVITSANRKGEPILVK